jgi:hypothetical protein
MRSRVVALLDHEAMRGWDELLSSIRVRLKSDILATPDEHWLVLCQSFSQLASAGLDPVEVEG